MRTTSSWRRGTAVFAVPGALFLIVFAVYPLILTVINSFRRVTVPGLISGHMSFIGFQNYRKIVADPQFWSSAWRTLLFTVVCVAFQFTLGLLAAVLLNRPFRGRGVLRGLLMVPWVLPIVVIGSTFKWMFQSGNGLVNTVLGYFGIHGPGWLEQPGLAFVTIIVANIWFGFPFAMQNLSAALQTVPVQVLEAASVDGASAVKRFFQIVMPIISGPIAILLTVQIIYTFNVFELILVMTGGGPAGSTAVVTYYTYQLGFEYFDLGPASAATILILIALGAFSALYVWLTSRGEKAA
ncbi:carbohydrate ABC transporter permease [Acidipropionibacterium virtanenii]|uniref:Inner membrane ABC transporter permease protein YcjO n=1 Tax=Acidipropionibacterium virtanenii TaxID=2057246 RepID=A0A344UQW7_9ACTN|nr:sugar ABC transporter permease [Acidipropionibacterium virtanenii]AXE37665.1 Inner membrane ABC transporter permease protein YcjO [Acidipropionibacterium virtanenii]